MVVAPFTSSYSTRSAYLTLEEFRFSPTASVIDTTQLVDQGGQAAQDRALSDLITRASNMIDTYTTGKGYGTIGASLNSESGRYYANRQGQFIIKPNFTPIIELVSFSYGATMGNQVVVPLSADNCSVEESAFIVWSWGSSNGIQLTGQNFGLIGGFSNRQKAFVNYSYVNGWANAFLTADAAQGATSLDLTNVIGIYPSNATTGQNYEMTLWDGMNTENIVVAPTYVAGTPTLTIQSPLQYRHGAGCNVSTLPPVVKQACIHFVVHLVEQRGEAGITLAETGFTESAGKSGTGMDHYAMGNDMLDEFMSQWGRS